MVNRSSNQIMAKSKMPAGFGGMGGMGGMNMNTMLKQAQKMQADMEKSREELETREYAFSRGGGVVNAKVSGKKKLIAIEIKPEAVDPDETELLCDMIIAAVNGALKMAADDADGEMKKLTGGASLPGMF